MVFPSAASVGVAMVMHLSFIWLCYQETDMTTAVAMVTEGVTDTEATIEVMVALV